MHRIPAAAKRLLASPHLFWALPLLVTLILSPGLGGGLYVDDHMHREALKEDPAHPELRRSPAMLFSFLNGDPQQVKALVEAGLWPWWTDPELRLAFLRPLAGLSHHLDWTLWPGSPLVMHLHSALWYLGVVVCLLALYRRLLTPPWVAGLGALLFAVDESQTFPALWLANRNAAMAGLFGFLALWAHDRWRRDRWRPGAWLAPASLLAAVLSNEGAVAAGGYLLAHALFLDPTPRRRALLSILPCASVGVLWALAYRWAGFGAAGSGVYIDPGASPLRFLGALAERAPVLLWGQWAWPPADLFMMLSGAGRTGMVLAAWGLGLVLARLLWPLLRSDPVARFLACGMVLSLIPASSTFPSNRLLFFTGLGAAGLLAMLLARGWAFVRRTAPSIPRAATLGAFAVVLPIHLVLPPLSVTAYLTQMQRMEQLIQTTAASLPGDDGASDQEAVVVSTVSGFVSLAAAVVRLSEGGPQPKRSLVLSSSLQGLEIHRPDEYTLVLRPEGGFLTPIRPSAEEEGPVVDPRRVFSMLDHLFRDPVTRPFEVGQRRSLGGVEVEVLTVSADGRPLEAAFHFKEPLESPRWRWLQWRDGQYRSFVPPAVGESTRVPGLDGPGQRRESST
ncbi:MAG: hypothetical protein AAGN66_12165 [Acidobacteriota bacterium]